MTFIHKFLYKKQCIIIITYSNALNTGKTNLKGTCLGIHSPIQVDSNSSKKETERKTKIGM